MSSVRLNSEEWRRVQSGQTVYVVKRKWNEDDGSWWLIAEVNNAGYEYLGKRYGSKSQAQQEIDKLIMGQQR